MYKTIIPAYFSSACFNHDRVLDDLKIMKTDLLLLPGFDYIHTDPNKMEPFYEKLEAEIPWFKARGIRVGVWFWTFIIQGPNHFTKMVDVTGNSTGDKGISADDAISHVCPLDEDYIRFMQAHVKRVAEMRPELILFDDDYSLGHHSSKPAQMCLCDLHLKKIGRILNEEPPKVEGLFEKMFSGKPNRYRSAFMKASGESLEAFAERMREAVDEVDPSIRMAQCGCIACFDGDGTDPFTISKKLAGDTAPFLRLSGAPYWQDRDYPGGSKDQSKMIEVIEMSRLERSWYDGDDISIVSEGDTYPRPRTHCPASFLNLFDAALRADGHLDGIQHYSFDYVSSADYERGYIDSHVRMADDLDRLYETFSHAETTGLRIYESMKKIEDADFSREPVTTAYVRNQFFVRSIRYTAHNSLPVTFYGPGCAGLMFGESARHFGDEVLQKPLILDAAAALILQERGVDVGIVSLKDRRLNPGIECFKNGERVLLCKDNKGLNPAGYAEMLTLNEKADVLSTFETPDGWPASYAYENSAGQKFLVFAVNAYLSSPDYYRSYMRQAGIFDFLESAGTPLPVRTEKHPDLYVVAAKEPGALHVALFNCFADEIYDLKLRVAGCFEKCGIHRAEGTVSGDTVTIRHLPAFGWCDLTLYNGACQ